MDSTPESTQFESSQETCTPTTPPDSEEQDNLLEEETNEEEETARPAGGPSWTPQQLQEAMGKVNSKELTCKTASDLYRIRYTTLNDWCNGKRTSHRHGKTVLLAKEEEALAEFITEMYEMSRSLPMHIVRDKVKRIVADGRDHPFRFGRPGNVVNCTS